MGAGRALMVLFNEGGKVLYKAVAKTISDIMVGDRMSKMEAEMILDISPSTSEDKVRESFLRMYYANAKENGGSPYIQSKILGAYTVLSGTSPRLLNLFEVDRRARQEDERKAPCANNKRFQL
ncbi:hypothetical protein EROM_110570 [Encephalitozoon romaleae SJ-2008]|uniref:Uncharacterized protein n=1 Tax=Encephalitozoon romaleae (strain SJ-2008) TaxID=1178016 RepID=I7AQ84_ENCRO|nr:hypothetical protein EROM_110570 [Encephalitozoon romaleae SJ-2008]AFN84039.1 hypothetical protein EROM_110570 [Encephalitozoon romaleae SJ-2008]